MSAGVSRRGGRWGFVFVSRRSGLVVFLFGGRMNSLGDRFTWKAGIRRETMVFLLLTLNK